MKNLNVLNILFSPPLPKKGPRLTQHLSFSFCIIGSSQSSHPPACQGQRLRKRREIRGKITREDSRHYCPNRGEAGGTNNEGGRAHIQGRSNLSTNRPKFAP